MTDILRARREAMRWTLLNGLNNARPLGAMDVLLLSVLQSLYPDATAKELHAELEYLESKDLVVITRRPDGHWHSKLSAKGIDVVEYTVACPAGINQPVKYWG